jgi:hypothetical protein
MEAFKGLNQILTMHSVITRTPVAHAQTEASKGLDQKRTVRVFYKKFTFEDAIGSHACSLEALACA